MNVETTPPAAAPSADPTVEPTVEPGAGPAPGVTAPAEQRFSLDHQLCFAAYSASRALVSAYRRGLSEVGLTYTQYLVLLVLWEHERVSVGELGEALALDSGTLSPLLKRMETSGLVRRERGVEDERTVWIQTTEAGRALLPHAMQLQSEVARATGLPRAELDALRVELHQLTAALDSAGH